MRKTLVALFAAAVLTGCGTTQQDRGVSGAGIGAATGAIVGAVTGLTVVEGALIGAAAGGLTGVLTNENQINLGKPAWKQGGNNSGTYRTNSDMVASIQSGLSRLGYDPGPADGVSGEKTRQAIRAYQQHHGLLVDGRATDELAAHIRKKS